MFIKILDRDTLGEDTPIELLSELGELEIYRSTSPAEAMERIVGAEVVVINKVKLTSEVLRRADKLKLICVFATGFDNIDIAYDILNKKEKKTNQKSKKVEGKIQGTTKGYAFLIPDDITIDDVFIPERELNGAMHNDRVVVVVKPTGGKRQEGKVIQVLERGSDRIVGILKVVKKIAYVVPDDVKFGKDI